MNLLWDSNLYTILHEAPKNCVQHSTFIVQVFSETKLHQIIEYKASLKISCSKVLYTIKNVL